MAAVLHVADGTVVKRRAVAAHDHEAISRVPRVVEARENVLQLEQQRRTQHDVLGIARRLLRDEFAEREIRRYPQCGRFLRHLDEALGRQVDVESAKRLLRVGPDPVAVELAVFPDLFRRHHRENMDTANLPGCVIAKFEYREARLIRRHQFGITRQHFTAVERDRRTATRIHETGRYRGARHDEDREYRVRDDVAVDHHGIVESG